MLNRGWLSPYLLPDSAWTSPKLLPRWLPRLSAAQGGRASGWTAAPGPLVPAPGSPSAPGAPAPLASSLASVLCFQGAALWATRIVGRKTCAEPCLSEMIGAESAVRVPEGLNLVSSLAGRTFQLCLVRSHFLWPCSPALKHTPSSDELLQPGQPSGGVCSPVSVVPGAGEQGPRSEAAARPQKGGGRRTRLRPTQSAGHTEDTVCFLSCKTSTQTTSGGRGDTGTYFLWNAGPRSLSPHPMVDPPPHRCLLSSFPLSWGSPGARGRRRLPLPGGQLQAGPCGAGPALGRVSKSVTVVWYLPLLRSPHITRPKFRV